MNPSLAPALDQSCPFEHVEMAGYGRKRDAKRPGQSGYAPFAAPGKALHDAAAGRVGESRKHIRHLLSIVNHGVKYNLRSSPVKRIVNDAVKYLRERTIGSRPGAAPPNPKLSRRAGLTKAAASRPSASLRTRRTPNLKFVDRRYGNRLVAGAVNHIYGVGKQSRDRVERLNRAGGAAGEIDDNRFGANTGNPAGEQGTRG